MKRRLVQTAFPAIVLFALFALSSENLAGASLGAARAAASKPRIRASKSAGPADSTGLANSSAERVPSPADVLGFKPGDDRKLADWSQIVSYFKRLGSASPRVSVQESGLTTERRPFIYAVISSEDNIRNLASIRESQRKLADPRLISSDEERDRLIRETPAVVAITCSIHSTEIGASQMSMELAYRLASDDSPHTRQILSNVILLLVPSVNPDGIDIVTDWYRKTLNTKYEGTAPPVLYHHYTGHDDNRDWFMLTQVETRELASILWKQWFPEIVYDVHQQGQYGSRICVPPFFDPPNPNIDPLILREVGWIGERMAVNLTAAGFKGVVSNSTYDTWWHGGLRTAPYYHNEIGILTEAASVKIATPLEVKREQLRAPVRGLTNPLVTATNFPVAWEGGTWRLRDIIDMELVTTRTALDEASLHKEDLIGAFVNVAKREIEAGQNQPPYAYVIPATQHDSTSTERMIDILMQQGVEVQRAKYDVSTGGQAYPAGSFVILMNQPYRSDVKCLFEAQHYPDRRLYPGGPAEPPYDVAGWTLPMQMGVDYKEIDQPVENTAVTRLEKIDWRTHTRNAAPGLTSNESMTEGFVISDDSNASFKVVNDCLAPGEHYSVSRAFRPAGTDDNQIARGAFVIKQMNGAPTEGPCTTDLQAGVNSSADNDSGNGNTLIRILPGVIRQTPKDLQLTSPLPEAQPIRRIEKPRIGVYRSWVPSMDEGWLRWVLEQFKFEYTTVYDADIRKGNLHSRFDVLIIPDEGETQIVNGNRAGSYPDEYTGGVGDAGVEALKNFARDGGVLIFLNQACELALQRFDLPVKNTLAGLKRDQFYAPGSIFRARIDTNNPIGYGMPPEADLYFISGVSRPMDEGPGAARRSTPSSSSGTAAASPRGAGALGPDHKPATGGDTSGQIKDGQKPEDHTTGSATQGRPDRRRSGSREGEPSAEDGRGLLVRAFAFDITDPSRAASVARYINENPLRSGWLLGPNYVEGKSALVDVKFGKGRAVLFGFPPEHRAQTWGTFKLLFNSILLGGTN